MSQQLIPWGKIFLLQWSDYTGIPKSAYEAYTTTKIQYHCTWEYIGKTSIKKFQFTTTQAYAFFNPKQSSARPELFIKGTNYQKKILKHEQGHFDIAEKFARKLANRLRKEFKNRKYSCHGVGLKKQKDDADKRARKVSKKIWNKLRLEWKAYEKKYDKETNHGLIQSAQKRYDNQFAKLRS